MNIHPRRLGVASLTHRWLYGAGAVLALSGFGWLATLAAGHHDGLAGSDKPWWLCVHGAAVFAFLVAGGSELAARWTPGAAPRVNYAAGAALATLALLTASGYGLYYVVDEPARQWISTLHWGLGMLAAAGFVGAAIAGNRGSRASSRWAGHRPATSLALLNVLTTAAGNATKISRADRVLFTASEFWAAARNRTLIMQLAEDPVARLRASEVAFTVMGLEKTAGILRHGRATIMACDSQLVLREVSKNIEDALDATLEPVDKIIADFANANANRNLK